MRQEFNDFSGGLTEKTIPGVLNRYSTMDNIVLDRDGKFMSRDGFDIFSSTAYQVGTAERISRLVNFDNDSELIALHNKKLEYISGGAWTSLLGPASGNPFNTNSATSLVSDAQWNKHLYLASDSGDPVIKVYRDGSSVLQLRTAGLPAMRNTTYPTDGGLADAITLANDLRTKMIAHYGSNGASAAAGPYNDTAKAHVSHADLTSQASAVTASSAATNLATLITLLNTLRAQYTLHILDAKKQPYGSYMSEGKNYHVAPSSSASLTAYKIHTSSEVQPTTPWFNNLNFSLAATSDTISTNITISEVLPYLNELRDKWNWHTYAPLTHYNAFAQNASYYYTGLGYDKTSIARVLPYTWATITPNLGYFYQYVWDLYGEFNSHVSGTETGTHINTVSGYDSIQSEFASITSTVPTSFQNAIVGLAAVAQFFTQHYYDAYGATFYQYTADSTSGSAILTNVAPNPTGEVGSGTGWRVVPILGAGTTPFTWAYASGTFTTINNAVTATAATTITHTSNFSANNTALQFVHTNARYHTGYTSVQPWNYTAWVAALEALDSNLTTVADLQGYFDLAEDLYDAIRTHRLYNTTALTTYDNNKVYVKNSPYTVYSFNTTTQALGRNYNPHLGYSKGAASVKNAISYSAGSGGVYLNEYKEDYFTDHKPTAASFLFKSCFKYDYTVGTTAYTDRGPDSDPITVIGCEPDAFDDPDEAAAYAFSFTNFYAHANASNENWYIGDTTNFKKEIYRTIANGTQYYKTSGPVGLTGEITNAATTYSDLTVDENIISTTQLYSDGGVASNTKPPAATLLHHHQNRLYYVLGNKLYLSKDGDPDSVPADWYQEFPEAITGISSTRDNVLVATYTSIYRTEGVLDDLGNGTFSNLLIYDRMGCVASQSMVQAEGGVFFVGLDGVYFTDGVNTFRATDLPTTFSAYVNSSSKRNRVQGCYDKVGKRVYYTIQANNALSDPDILWVLDLNFGIKPGGVPVTTFSGGFDSYTGFRPTAITFYGGILHYGDNSGYVYKQTSGLNLDLNRDTGAAATSWSYRAILWDHKTCHLDFGGGDVRKFFTRCTYQFEQQSTNLSVQISSDADKGRVTNNLPIIRSRKLTDWGDSKIDWISSVYTTLPIAGNVIDETRRFKGDGSLRSNFRALEIKNAYCVIVASDQMGLVNIANISANVWSLTLVNAATRKWPLYSVGYYVRIAGVDYPVTVRTSDSVVRVSDSGLTALSVQSNVEWEMWGYPKNEKMRCIQYTVDYELLGQQQKDYQGSTSLDGGENA